MDVVGLIALGVLMACVALWAWYGFRTDRPAGEKTLDLPGIDLHPRNFPSPSGGPDHTAGSGDAGM